MVRHNNVQQRPSGRMSNRNHPSGLFDRPISLDHSLILKWLTINSTTLIPKCSSTIVLSPAVAAANHVNSSEYGALTTNSTASYSSLISLVLSPGSIGRTSISSSLMSLLRVLTR